MNPTANFSIRTLSGDRAEVPISLETYRAAEHHGISLAQYVNLQNPTNAEQDGSAFDQMMQACGIYLSTDRRHGIRPPTLRALLDGTAVLQGSAITRPDGSDQTSSGRILFPAVLLEVLEATLRDNRDSYLGAFMSMIAQTVTIATPKYEQVIIDHSAPQAARGQPIGQLDRPNRLLTLRTSQVSRAIPTYSIGIEFSREAAAAATLDIIALAVREHAAEERAAALDRDIVAMVNGDPDNGTSALDSVPMQDYDSTISAAGEVTHIAWVKYLRQKWRKRVITDVICTLDEYLAVENRSGRPVKNDEPAVDERLNATPRIMLPGIPQNVNFFTLEEPILGANTLVGLDRSKAMRRIVYAGGSYQAVEDFVMTRSQSMRMDWAERVERAGYVEAFEKVTLTV